MASNWQPDRPYDSLPPLPPAVDLETKVVLKQCVAARAALAELKQATELIPNPTMLINTLPVLEARASSEIENIVTTADTLFQHLAAEGAVGPTTKEALRYRQALLEGFGGLENRPLSTRTAEAVCSRIRGVEMSVRRVPGTALANAATGAVIFTPPATEEGIRKLLGNWERFLHEHEEIDPLIRMAAAHYQFEAIHPFTDGNGRTGRVLNSLFLVEQGLLSLPILYLSDSSSPTNPTTTTSSWGSRELRHGTPGSSTCFAVSKKRRAGPRRRSLPFAALQTIPWPSCGHDFQRSTVENW
jgi:Fic family protein